MVIPNPPSIEEIRALSSSFKKATIAVDGFHPRHVMLLCDEALGVFRQVMAAMTVAGAVPTWMRKLVLALFRKP
eukprot:5053688-Pyramimonas_sp.AAC.1